MAGEPYPQRKRRDDLKRKMLKGIKMNIDELINYAKSFLGLPYIWGGDDPIKGFDCSGLIQEILESVGIDPPGDQTAHQLYEHFKKVGTICPPEKGALVFFGSMDKVTHIALCLDELHMLEAGGGGSKCLTRDDAAIQNAFVRIRPIARRKDKVCFIMPKYSFLPQPRGKA